MDVREAAELAVSLAPVPGTEDIALASALGRVAARRFAADKSIPAEPRSRWDGFAIKSSDSMGASPSGPAFLEILPEEVTAGRLVSARAASGMCFRIMTGAVLPEGTDAVVPLEDFTTQGNRLVLDGPVAREKGVIRPGSDAAGGDVLIEKGDVLTPTRLALVAATGADRVRVFRRPRVAVLSTGDELRPVGGEPGGPVVFCNNYHLLANLVTVGGGEPILLGIAPDNTDVICSRFEQAEADLVITTGGMGKGSRDFILEAWQRLGVSVQFDRLNISPGKGSALGTGSGRTFLGLPGNPWASQIVYEEIAAPMLRAYQGVRAAGKFAFDARLSAGLGKKPGLYQAFYGEFSTAGKPAFIPSTTAPTHSRLAQLRNGFTYILPGPGKAALREGEPVEVKIPDFPLLAWALLHSTP